jgi:hypothetical protein
VAAIGHPRPDLSAPERAKIRRFPDGFGEGVAVRLVGYMAPHTPRPKGSGPHPGGAESVNCCFGDHDPAHSTVDFHIPVRERVGQSECEGVVVEMIPESRPSSWTVEKLRRTTEKKVMFVGLLLFDNEHQVHDDCATEDARVRSQPKRMSLWEVHPVVEAYVCRGDGCTADSMAGWEPL